MEEDSLLHMIQPSLQFGLRMNFLKNLKNTFTKRFQKFHRVELKKLLKIDSIEADLHLRKLQAFALKLRIFLISKHFLLTKPLLRYIKTNSNFKVLAIV